MEKTHAPHREGGRSEANYFRGLRGYAVKSDASFISRIDSGCRMRDGQAQLPDHVNHPSVTVLGVVKRVVARNSLRYHQITSATTVEI